MKVRTPEHTALKKEGSLQVETVSFGGGACQCHSKEGVLDYTHTPKIAGNSPEVLCAAR